MSSLISKRAALHHHEPLGRNVEPQNLLDVNTKHVACCSLWDRNQRLETRSERAPIIIVSPQSGDQYPVLDRANEAFSAVYRDVF